MPWRDLLAEAGDRAGQVLDRADHDLVLADALLLRQRRSGGSRATSAAATVAMQRFMVVSLRCLVFVMHGSAVRRYMASIALAYFASHQLALELHRRRQLLVLGGQLRLEQAELLDLLDARELAR